METGHYPIIVLIMAMITMVIISMTSTMLVMLLMMTSRRLIVIMMMVMMIMSVRLMMTCSHPRRVMVLFSESQTIGADAREEISHRCFTKACKYNC